MTLQSALSRISAPHSDIFNKHFESIKRVILTISINFYCLFDFKVRFVGQMSSSGFARESDSLSTLLAANSLSHALQSRLMELFDSNTVLLTLVNDVIAFCNRCR